MFYIERDYLVPGLAFLFLTGVAPIVLGVSLPIWIVTTAFTATNFQVAAWVGITLIAIGVGNLYVNHQQGVGGIYPYGYWVFIALVWAALAVGMLGYFEKVWQPYFYAMLLAFFGSAITAGKIHEWD